jgi:LacI family transcriptional regulator
MKHVAAAADVSVMTVSLALRGDSSIPPATQRRVNDAARRIGYRPNPLVSALMAGLRGRHPRGRGAHLIAYVDSFGDRTTAQQRASLLRYRNGASAAAERHGYRLQDFSVGHSGLTPPRLEQVLQARGIRGLVLAPFPVTGSELSLDWSHFAAAAIGFSLSHPNLHRAVNHQAQTARHAIRRLLELGYQRIGIALSQHENARAQRNWVAAALLARFEHNAAGLTFPLLLEERIEPARLRAWCRAERPEVILTSESDIRSMVGARGPHVAHLHLTPNAAGFSGMDQANERVGAAAVDLVVEQLHANLRGVPEHAKTVLVEGQWVDGQTAPGPRVQRSRRQGSQR